MNKASSALLILALVVFCSSHAQHVSELDEIIILDSVQSPLSSSYVQTIDSLSYSGDYKYDNLASLLASKTSLYIKSAGPGLLATPTFRGGDANHTSVLWNGMKINSPMLGSIDFNTINVGSFDQIQILTSTSSNIYGSGGLGGAINLNNRPSFNKPYSEVTIQTGSFGNSMFSVGVNAPFKLGGIPFSFSVHGQRKRMKNKFSYLNNKTLPYSAEVMNDADFRIDNMIYSLVALPSDKIVLTFNYWTTDVDRSIPNPISAPKQHAANQSDTSYRFQVGMDWHPNQALTVKQFFTYEWNVNQYQDSNINLINSNRYYSLQSLTVIGYRLNKSLEGKLQTNNSWSEAKSGNYNGYQHQFINSSLFALIYQPFHRLRLELGMRSESVLKQFQALPFGGFTFRLHQKKNVHLIASASKTARFPTLNELYWNPGGNLTLKPEIGLSAESGIKGELGHFEFKSVWFASNYRDRIRWISNGTVFSPTNIAESKVKGIDANLSWKMKTNRLKVKLNSAISYTESMGKLIGQSEAYALSFVPKWTSTSSGIISYKSIQVMLINAFFGKRYISNDESAFMPSYFITDLTIVWKQQNGPMALNLGINNLFDRNYQNLPWRPMPSRSFSIGLTIRSE